MMKIFALPIYADDEEKTRSARIIIYFVLVNLPILILSFVAQLITGTELVSITSLVLISNIVYLTIVWFFAKTGKVRLAAYLHTISTWLTATVIAFALGTGARGSVFVSYFIVMLEAAVLLGWAAAVRFGALCILSGFGLAAAENMGYLVYKQSPATNAAIEGGVLLLFGGIFIYLIISSLQTAMKSVKNTASELHIRNLEFRTLSENLEQQVSQRTGELESARADAQKTAHKFRSITEVTRAINITRHLHDLLPEVTTLISTLFSFYHVGIFLVDSSNQYAILSASNSEEGKIMLARGHKIKIGDLGAVGYVSQSGNPRVAFDVDTKYFNSALPLTRSEMALPLKTGGRIIGVLDVQSTEADSFTDQDIDVLSTLAEQVSLAIQNVRLLDETEKSLTETNAIQRQHIHETWNSLPKEEKLRGFRYSVAGAVQINDENMVTIDEGLIEKREVSVPIILRGETIGTLSVQVPKNEKIATDQMDLIKAVAERVALSAENARLFGETTRRAENERIISDIASKIGTSVRTESILRTTATELSQLLEDADIIINLHTANNDDTVAK